MAVLLQVMSIIRIRVIREIRGELSGRGVYGFLSLARSCCVS